MHWFWLVHGSPTLANGTQVFLLPTVMQVSPATHGPGYHDAMSWPAHGAPSMAWVVQTAGPTPRLALQNAPSMQEDRLHAAPGAPGL